MLKLLIILLDHLSSWLCYLLACISYISFNIFSYMFSYEFVGTATVAVRFRKNSYSQICESTPPYPDLPNGFLLSRKSFFSVLTTDLMEPPVRGGERCFLYLFKTHALFALSHISYFRKSSNWFNTPSVLTTNLTTFNFWSNQVIHEMFLGLADIWSTSIDSLHKKPLTSLLIVL